MKVEVKEYVIVEAEYRVQSQFHWATTRCQQDCIRPVKSRTSGTKPISLPFPASKDCLLCMAHGS